MIVDECGRLEYFFVFQFVSLFCRRKPTAYDNGQYENHRRFIAQFSERCKQFTASEVSIFVWINDSILPNLDSGVVALKSSLRQNRPLHSISGLATILDAKSAHNLTQKIYQPFSLTINVTAFSLIVSKTRPLTFSLSLSHKPTSTNVSKAIEQNAYSNI